MSQFALGGLVSGMDTESVIQKLLQVESMRVRLQENRKAQAGARQKAWSSVESGLGKLKAKLEAIRFPSAYQARSATLTDANVASVAASAGATLVTHSLEVKELARTHVVAGAYQSSPNSALGAAGTLTIGGKAVTVTAQDTLHSLRDKINGTAEIGAGAEVVKVMQGTTESYRLVLTAKASGTAGAIAVADDADGVARALGFLDGAGVIKNELSAAMDASFVLNGVTYATGSNTVSDVLPGITLTLKSKGSTSVTVGQDPDKLVEAVQAWVEELNSNLTQLADLTKAGENGKGSGALNGDPLARRLQQALRSQISAVQGDIANKQLNQLSQAGVRTGAWGTADFGKVVLDKAKLREQLLADPDGVARLFGAMRENVAAGVTPVAGSVDTSDPTRVYSATDITNGDTDSLRFGSVGGGWQSQNPPAPGESLTFTFSGPKQIDQIELHTPDTTASAGLKRFTVEYLTAGNTWEALQTVSDYSGGYRLLEFGAVTTSQVRLRIDETYGNGPAQVTELKVNAANQGPATAMYGFVRQTLAASTGPIASKSEAITKQISAIDKQIQQMSDRVAEQEKRLRQQFTRMEAALAKMRSQGSAFMAQMMSMNQTGGM